MAYAFRRTCKSPQKNLRHIARDHLDASLALLDRRRIDAAALHELRKTVKKLRALARLCAAGFRSHKAIDRTLRDAGRAIAPLRDQDALLDLFDRIAALPGPRLAGLHALRAAYAARFTATPTDRAAALTEHYRALRTLRDQTDRWKFDARGFAALEPGLRATYGKARKMMKPALRHPGGDLLHEWRKRVKDHGYHARLLQPIWPEVMEAHVRALTRLGDLLGEARDCAILAEHLDTLPGGAALANRARTRERTILAEVAPLARLVFADKAPRLAARWRAWWRLWTESDATPPGDERSAGQLADERPFDQPDRLLHAV
jgi:CHAD domain-containing protein